MTFSFSVRILIATVPFFPLLGGVETVAGVLAREWRRAGHDVVVATMAAAAQADDLPYTVVRQPSASGLLRLYHSADAVFLQGLSLRMGWPALLSRTPLIITHHMVLNAAAYSGWWRNRLLRRATNVAVSNAVAHSVPAGCQVIKNPYDDEVFCRTRDRSPSRDLVFVGRLDAGKGADTLLHAINQLKSRGTSAALTIIGDGVEKAALVQLSTQLGLQERVRFAGSVSGTALADILRDHRILVMPSRVPEGYGIIAIEGLACGCMVVGSSVGGLPEAIGNCGEIVPAGDPAALADILEKLIDDEQLQMRYRANAAAQVRQHDPRVIARRYLEIIRAGA